jgi:anti-anti-sigma factor
VKPNGRARPKFLLAGLYTRRFPSVARHILELMGSLMSAVHKANFSVMRRSRNRDHFSGDGVWLNAHTLDSATVVAAAGELDASNIHRLTDYARSCLTDGHALVLDFSRLDFFGAQGIWSLLEIADDCGRSGIDWALVPGHAVHRLLRIFENDAQLPLASSITEALERFSAPGCARSLLQLVPKSG